MTEPKRSLSVRLKIGFSFGFALFFSLLLCTVLIRRTNSPLPLLGCILLSLLLLCGVRAGIDRLEGFLTRRFSLLVSVGFLLLFFLQLLLGAQLRFDPVFDLEAIYQSAIDWVYRNSISSYASPTCHPDYFLLFPNNLGGVTFLSLLFHLGFRLGTTDFFGVAMTGNALLASVSMVLTVLVARELFSVKAACFTLALFLLFPPFYVLAPVFYTDCITLIFPILGFYLYLRAKRSRTLLSRSMLWFAAGLVVSLGVLIKATVGIVLIAMLLDQLLSGDWRQGIRFALCTGLTLIVVFTNFNAAIYGTMLNKNRAAEQKMPLSYWTAMAFYGDGSYNQADFELAYFIADPAKRKETMQSLTRDRITALGLPGLIRLFAQKGGTLMEAGTLNLSDFLDDRPLQNSALHRFLLYDGAYYPLYRLVCTGYLLAVWLLAILSGWRSGQRREHRLPCFVPQLCITGIFLFLFVWECNGRLLTNLLPMLFLCGTAGMSELRLPARFKAMLKRNEGTH